MRIIACYVVANEADHIADSLRSVKAYVDGFVIVDSLFETNPTAGTHSSDATREICARICAPLPLTYIESAERLDEPRARNRYLAETEGEWCLMLDGDEQLYGEWSAIVQTMMDARSGRLRKALDVPVYTVAVNFNGQATDMDPEDYAVNPLISTMGHQPRLFFNAPGLHYAFDAGRGGWGGALWDASGRILRGRKKTRDLFIINHHTWQTFESYQNDYAWEHAAAVQR